jgi:hypothetical protein
MKLRRYQRNRFDFIQLNSICKSLLSQPSRLRNDKLSFKQKYEIEKLPCQFLEVRGASFLSPDSEGVSSLKCRSPYRRDLSGSAITYQIWGKSGS